MSRILASRPCRRPRLAPLPTIPALFPLPDKLSPSAPAESTKRKSQRRNAIAWLQCERVQRGRFRGVRFDTRSKRVEQAAELRHREFAEVRRRRAVFRLRGDALSTEVRRLCSTNQRAGFGGRLGEVVFEPLRVPRTHTPRRKSIAGFAGVREGLFSRQRLNEDIPVAGVATAARRIRRRCVRSSSKFARQCGFKYSHARGGPPRADTQLVNILDVIVRFFGRQREGSRFTTAKRAARTAFAASAIGVPGDNPSTHFPSAMMFSLAKPRAALVSVQFRHPVPLADAPQASCSPAWFPQ